MRKYAITITAIISTAFVIQAAEVVAESGALSDEPAALALTEIGQLPAIFNAQPWSYPQMTPIEPALFEGVDVVWADFTQLPKEFTAIPNYPSYDLHGIRAWPLRLIRFEDTAELVADYPWFEVELVRVPWPKDRKPRCSYDELLRVWAILLGQNPAPYEELLKQGHTLLEPPRSILHFWLADVLDCPVYEYNIASEVFFEATLSLAAEVTEESGGGMSLLMFGESGSPPCARSKFTRLEVSGGDFVLEWLSETNATYEVAHATDLVVADRVSLATQYAATAGTNVTSFVHSGGATNQTGFYKVAQTGIRILLCDSNTYSGVLDIPVEVGMPNNQELTGIYFLVDGEPTMALVSPQYPFSGTPTATLDTASISNGWHTMQAFAEYPTGQNQAGG